MSEIFYFRFFAICQDENVMKVGTDSMLLGAWAEPGDSKNILDIGTGTSVLSLMMAQKSQAKIDALEPEGKAYELAKLNVSNCRWKNRIQVIHSSLQDFNPGRQYDFIITNPPFYKPYLRYGKQSPSEARRKIRSHEGLALNELLEHSLRLLSSAGRLCLILPVNIIHEFIQEAENKGLWLNRKLLIQSKPNTNPIRCIAQFSRIKNEDSKEEINIFKSSGSYSPAYLDLTKDFHAIVGD